MQEWTERMRAITVAIETGNIERSKRAELVQFNAWLCHSNAGMHFGKNYDQVCETVRLHLLRSMIDAFEERSKTMQWFVIAIASASLLVAGAQIWFAYKADKKAETMSTSPAPSQLSPTSPTLVPSLAQPPSSRPAHTAPPAKQLKDGAQKP